MLPSMRINAIKQKLVENGSVSVVDLAKEFKVSEETVRRDLGKLEKEGIATKNYGGAILADDMENVKYPSSRQRVEQDAQEKLLIADAAAAMVREDSVVLLDSGSTTRILAEKLRTFNRLTVLTNNLDIALICSEMPNWNLYLMGGYLLRKSMCFIDAHGRSSLENIFVDIGFIGCSGITYPTGLCCWDIYEAPNKRAMIKASDKVVVLADHTKFNKRGLGNFASFDDIDEIITGREVDRGILKEIQQGTNVKMSLV